MTRLAASQHSDAEGNREVPEIKMRKESALGRRDSQEGTVPAARGDTRRLKSQLQPLVEVPFSPEPNGSPRGPASAARTRRFEFFQEEAKAT